MVCTRRLGPWAVLLTCFTCLCAGILSPSACVAAGVTDRAQIQKNIRNAIQGRFPLYNLGFGNDVDFTFLEVMSMENNGWAQRIYEDHDAAQQLQVSPVLLTYHLWHAWGAHQPKRDKALTQSANQLCDLEPVT